MGWHYRPHHVLPSGDGDPGVCWSDRFGVGWRRAAFQVPLVIGYNLLSAITGIRLVAHNFIAFVALRLGVNLGAGWGEPIGISNTTEWWPKERHGFALGAHHTGYPVGALFSGLAVAGVLNVFGEDRWSYVFFIGLIVALPVMLFWRWYSTSERIQRTYASMRDAGLTVPLDTEEEESRADESGTLKRVLLNRGVLLTSGTTLLTQIVYMGINYVLPLYIANIVGLSFSGAASLSTASTSPASSGRSCGRASRTTSDAGRPS
ncbi:MFS transporter [Propioniferax innocua]|uniref:MFS transporter n=1 Tax=Propioniferax innocua TaxID=1753 RepID=UPI001B8653E7|nr:MFS transporter [Propioniferax innocua]